MIERWNESQIQQEKGGKDKGDLSHFCLCIQYKEINNIFRRQ